MNQTKKGDGPKETICVYLSSSVLDLVCCDFVSIKLHYYNREIFYTWGEKEVIFHTVTATFLNFE